MRHTNDHREKYETEKRNESRVVGVVGVPCTNRKERARKHGNVAPPAPNNVADRLGHGPPLLLEIPAGS